jgi:hypothetical protein
MRAVSGYVARDRIGRALGGVLRQVTSESLACEATMKYIVDTNIFNKLVDGLLDPTNLPVKGSFVATHLQIDEINNTKDNERRARLFLTFAEMTPEVVPSETMVIGVSRIGHAKIRANDPNTYDAVKCIAQDEMRRNRPEIN